MLHHLASILFWLPLPGAIVRHALATGRVTLRTWRSPEPFQMRTLIPPSPVVISARAAYWAIPVVPMCVLPEVDAFLRALVRLRMRDSRQHIVRAVQARPHSTGIADREQVAGGNAGKELLPFEAILLLAEISAPALGATDPIHLWRSP